MSKLETLAKELIAQAQKDGYYTWYLDNNKYSLRIVPSTKNKKPILKRLKNKWIEIEVESALASIDKVRVKGILRKIEKFGRETYIYIAKPKVYNKETKIWERTKVLGGELIVSLNKTKFINPEIKV